MSDNETVTTQETIECAYARMSVVDERLAELQRRQPWFEQLLATKAAEYNMDLHLVETKEILGLQAEKLELHNRVTRLKLDRAKEGQAARMALEPKVKAAALAAVTAYEQLALAMLDAALNALAAIGEHKAVVGQIQKFQEDNKRGPLDLRSPQLRILDLAQCLKMDNPRQNAIGQLTK